METCDSPLQNPSIDFGIHSGKKPAELRKNFQSEFPVILMGKEAGGIAPLIAFLERPVTPFSDHQHKGTLALYYL